EANVFVNQVVLWQLARRELRGLAKDHDVGDDKNALIADDDGRFRDLAGRDDAGLIHRHTAFRVGRVDAEPGHVADAAVGIGGEQLQLLLLTGPRDYLLGKDPDPRETE